ncbi:MAG: hypothetical protein CVT59_05420 [Actinobacteria bacterium HGW-Actinobacteria-1]|jgi:glycosyltransferase involved in cell wall biosynthesis|nr:MAG: hypothetical protein CVT59_05420 [Actinobacteria bacterium HGW-Actinobacteria-1]
MSAPYILFVDDYPHVNIGGGEQHLLRVARACLEWGYRVGVVCVQGSGLDAEVRSAQIESLPMPEYRGPGVGRALAALFTAEKPDIVHVHGFYAMTAACPAARRAGVPHILTTVHAMPLAAKDLRPGVIGRAEAALRSWLYRRTAGSVDRFVCVVDAARRELLGMGIAAEKLLTIANGIPDPRAGRVQREARASGPLVIGSVGRLERAKAYGDFIDAAALVLAADVDARFRLVGDGSERDALTVRASRLGLDERFEFMGWSDDALGEIAAMDVYVVTSVTETTNLSFLEAMALGIPVVATAVGGIPDIVADGGSGVLVSPHRPDELARAIADLAGDAALRDIMGAAGRERFESGFVLDHMLSEHRALYEALLGPTG